MDETRIERALRQGPPFRTHYVQQPIRLSPEVAPRPFASGTPRLVLLVAVMVLTFVASLAALTIAGFFRPQPIDRPAAIWSATGNMAGTRNGQTATLLTDGTVLVAGGDSSLGKLVELYDPASDTWTTAGPMLAARTGHSATLLSDGKVLVAGGYTSGNNPLASAELYDPATGLWTATGSMIETRHQHTATLLSDGKVLVVGGTTRLAAELYDPGGP